MHTTNLSDTTGDFDAEVRTFLRRAAPGHPRQVARRRADLRGVLAQMLTDLPDEMPEPEIEVRRGA